MIYISSDKPVERSFFEGFAFSGDDYICSEEGLRLFHQGTGRKINPGQDGCYVSVEPSESGWTIGTDHSGFKKLFIYSRISQVA